VTLLHCTSEYPAPVEQLNLLAIETLRKTFGLRVGYSDHSEGIYAAVAAVALGSVVIEKHFTLDKELEGPDHRASLSPEELYQMVKEIRKIEVGLGDGIKKPTTSELITQRAVRKSLYARKPIRAGELFTEYNLTTKRPQSGISPMEYWRILGTVSRISYEKDEQIR
jgi:N-acetylneuraminate synthase